MKILEPHYVFRRLSLRIFYGLLGAVWAPLCMMAVSQQAPKIPDKLDLRTAINIALENNFSIQQARERIREQDGLVIQAKAKAIPTLSLDADYGLSDYELLNEETSSHQDWGIALNVRQSLYAGGGIQAEIRSSELLREAAILELQSVINEALFDVRIKFYNVLLARGQIEVQEQNVQLYEEQLRDMKNRFDAGTVSNFEVIRAEVSLANAKPQLIRARNDYRVALDLLYQVLGFTTKSRKSPWEEPEVVGELSYEEETFELQKALEMSMKRPELQRLEKVVEAREANIDVQRAGQRPTLDLIGGYEYNKNVRSDSFRPGEARDGWTVGVVSSWAIFDGRAAKGKIAQAISQHRQAELSYLDEQLAVEVEVRSAISTLKEAVELVDAAQKVVGQAVEALRLANARYAAGNATQLDVLQAQVDLTSARDNQLQAYYSYNTALASVKKAIGIADIFLTDAK